MKKVWGMFFTILIAVVMLLAFTFFCAYVATYVGYWAVGLLILIFMFVCSYFTVKL